MKTSTHTVYKLKDGTIVPGGSTIANIGKDSGGLLQWAYNCGVKGENFAKKRDGAADIGTLTHYLILCRFTGDNPEETLKEYSSNDISIAQNCLKSFEKWKAGHDIDILIHESPMVSEKHRFGGTLDLLCKLDGRYTLCDWKTSNRLYKEYWHQVAGYGLLVKENTEYPVDQYALLRFGKEKNDDFECQIKSDLSIQEQIFLSKLDLYHKMKLEGK